jgi:hypothetical protein
MSYEIVQLDYFCAKISGTIIAIIFLACAVLSYIELALSKFKQWNQYSAHTSKWDVFPLKNNYLKNICMDFDV